MGWHANLKVGQWLKKGDNLVEITKVGINGFYDCVVYDSVTKEEYEYVVISTEWEIQEM